MGLDMRPMGKPKPGYEKRFRDIYNMVSQNCIQKASFFDKIFGKTLPSKEELIQEWLNIQIPSYETIKAPLVGRDLEADIWIKEKYSKSDKTVTESEFIRQYEGYYIIELAKEKDGVPVYISLQQDENVFRGQFLQFCDNLIGEELVCEAWQTKFADETLDYGIRLMAVADKIASENNLQFLKEQRLPPETDMECLENKLHIVYSLAKWLIFYGENGHGYEADF